MTRTKEILKEAEKAASANTQIIGDWGEHYLGFIHGAEWADAHPHWISVEDELPEVCVAVLTTTPHGTLRVGFYEDGWWLANTPDLVRMGSITHWMPLPEAPHHIIDANKKVDRVIGTADHIKTALDVLNTKGGEE